MPQNYSNGSNPKSTGRRNTTSSTVSHHTRKMKWSSYSRGSERCISGKNYKMRTTNYSKCLTAYPRHLLPIQKKIYLCSPTLNANSKRKTCLNDPHSGPSTVATHSRTIRAAPYYSVIRATRSNCHDALPVTSPSIAPPQPLASVSASITSSSLYFFLDIERPHNYEAIDFRPS